MLDTTRPDPTPITYGRDCGNGFAGRVTVIQTGFDDVCCDWHGIAPGTLYFGKQNAIDQLLPIVGSRHGIWMCQIFWYPREISFWDKMPPPFPPIDPEIRRLAYKKSLKSSVLVTTEGIVLPVQTVMASDSSGFWEEDK